MFPIYFEVNFGEPDRSLAAAAARMNPTQAIIRYNNYLAQRGDSGKGASIPAPSNFNRATILHTGPTQRSEQSGTGRTTNVFLLCFFFFSFTSPPSTGSSAAPPSLGGLLRFSFAVRPLAGVSSSIISMIASASSGRSFPALFFFFFCFSRPAPPPSTCCCCSSDRSVCFRSACFEPDRSVAAAVPRRRDRCLLSVVVVPPGCWSSAGFRLV
uniref:Uncharacterized protein n=1 Tax=Anopheles coluzzii TaxID=1518534 RepID=A0A8W7PZ16_ANOCL